MGQTWETTIKLVDFSNEQDVSIEPHACQKSSIYSSPVPFSHGNLRATPPMPPTPGMKANGLINHHDPLRIP